MADIPATHHTTSAPGSDPAWRAVSRVPIGSWDEFTRLREVVVGTATGATIPSAADSSAWLNLYPELPRARAAGAPAGPVSSRVIGETEEDLGELVRVLEGLDVTVHRAQGGADAAPFGAPGWQSTGMYAYCPRDVALVLGPTVVETASPTRARYFESFALRHLVDGVLTAGGQWLAMPQPRLEESTYLEDGRGRVRLADHEPLFEAANVLRLGRDLLYQVSGSGNERGLRWLRSLLGLLGEGIRVHPLRNMYAGTHIDSTIALLRPGLVLLNPRRVTPETVPRCFDGWEVVWCPEPAPGSVNPFDLSSPWISMNLLMVDTDLAVVDATHPALVRALERHGIDVIPLRLRHARTLGGGFHCVTLDLTRDGGPQDYTR